MRTCIGALLLAAFGTAGVTAAYAQPPPVEIQLQCLAAPKIADLRITLRNTSQEDVNVALGMTLGNGRSYHASDLVLEVRGRGGDRVESFQIVDSNPDIAGRVDPWILPLPAASEFSMTRALGDFAKMVERLDMGRAPMDLRLRLKPGPWLRPAPGGGYGPGIVQILQAELQSEWIRVPEDCAGR